MFSRRRKPNLHVVSSNPNNGSDGSQGLELRTIIITSAITALAVAVVSDLYQSAKKKVLNSGDDEMMRFMAMQQMQPAAPQPYAHAIPNPQPAAPDPSWEQSIKDRAEALKNRQRELDAREDELVARERRARLLDE